MESLNEIKFDKEFEKIENLKYLPWVGKDYINSEPEARNFIIAESVYNWAENDPDEYDDAIEALNSIQFVRVIVEKHGLFHLTNEGSQPYSRIARGTEKVITGKENLNDEQREDFWKKSCFHELVQRPLSSVDKRPTSEDYLKGAKVLNSLIKILMPTTIIFLGTDYKKLKFLENEFNSKLYWPTNDKINGATPNNMFVKIDKLICNIIFVKHPSRFISFEKWYEFINEAKTYIPNINV